ncbi:aqualysin-1-like isoform X2 [Glandiceps talaboti]
MKISVLCLMMFVSVALGTKAKFYKTNSKQKIHGSYLVVLKKHENVHDYEQRLVSKYGGDITVVNSFSDALNGLTIQVPDENDEMVITEILDDPSVDYIEEDASVSVAAPANSWGLDRIDQISLPLDFQYNPPGDGAGINVYVIDTGIYPNKDFFEKKKAGGPEDFLDFSGERKNRDCNGHGTHVAGTIGSKSYGVAPKVQLWNARVFGCSGSGSWSSVIAAINEIASRGTQPGVVNLSISGVHSQAANDAISNLRAQGYLPISAAGNNIGKDACLYSPGGSPYSVTVGGVMEDDTLWPGSNIGACVNIFAPAWDIPSLDNSKSGTTSLTGTSMAAPHVSGIAAVIWAQNPTWTADQVEQQIYARATSAAVDGIDPNASNNRLANINV